MLKYIFPLTVLVSLGFAAGDFLQFHSSPNIAFLVHNTVAALTGLGLIYFSNKLLKNKDENKHILLFSIIVGFTMVVIHLTKLWIGKCF